MISAAKVYVIGSTFANNAGASQHRQIKIDSGSVTFRNSVVWGTETGTTLAKGTWGTFDGRHAEVNEL